MKAVKKKDNLYIHFLFLFRDALGLWKESAAYGQVRFVQKDAAFFCFLFFITFFH